MKSTLKWKRAATIYPTDHIISSKAREVGALYGFKPLYENEKSNNIRFLLSNEYMRLWFNERELYQKENYAKQEKARNEANLRRGYVQRMLTISAPRRDLPDFRIKRFQTICSKVDTRRSVEEKAKICQRYKKTFEVVGRERYKPACPERKRGVERVGRTEKARGQKVVEAQKEVPTKGLRQLVSKLL